jgi:hypothetical protein
MLVICSAVRAAEDLPAEELVVQAAVHRLVHGMEFGFGSLWLITPKSVTLVRVEPKTNQIKEIWRHRINTPQTVAIGEAAVWVTDAKKKTIFGIDPTDYLLSWGLRLSFLDRALSTLQLRTDCGGPSAVWLACTPEAQA